MYGNQTLFNWSLKTDSRSVYPHIVRGGFAGFMLLSILAAWADASSGVAPGLGFFRRICFLNVLLITVAGISYFVSAVTEEKDSGTLSLLKLAGVTPLSIVLTKSTSRLVSSLMLLMIQLPFTLLAITLGGITATQIISAYIALAAYLCMVSSVALFCSVRCQTSGRAASLASGILLLFFLSGPLLSSVSGLSGVSWITPEVSRLCSDLYQQQQSASVITRLLDIFRTTGTASLFSVQFVSNIAASVVLFVLSVALFNRYSEPVEDTTHGTSVRVRRHTVGRCWSAPLVWKDFLFMTGGKPFFIVKLVAYALLACGFAWFNRHQHNWHGEWLNAELTSTALRTVIGFLTVEALLYSSNSLFLEVRQQAIGPLRMVPIPTSVALFQKAAACFIAMLPGMMTALALIIYRPSVLWSDRGVAEQTIAWLFVVFVSTHLTVLLSLYVRWAALPLAVLATSISFGCFVPLIMGMNAITRSVAAVNGIPFHVWTGVAVNFVWLWLFVLLPIEIEIVRRWNTLSGE